MSFKLPSICETDHLFANDDKHYVFENPYDLPVETLINQSLPINQNFGARSVKISMTAKPGFSEIYRNAAFPNGLKSCITKELDTYPKIFDSAVKRHPKAPCLSYHEYDLDNQLHTGMYLDISYEEVLARKDNLVSGLLYLLTNNPYKDLTLEAHQKIDNHERDFASYNKDNFSFVVTLYSGNRTEWILSDLACSANTIATAPLYGTMGVESSKYILETTQSPVLITARSKIESLLNLKRDNPVALKSLIMLVSMDHLGKEYMSLVKQADKVNIKLFDFSQVERVGAIFPRVETPPSPDSVYTITFTSGTTGSNPKGVVLLQRAVTCAITSLALLLPHSQRTKEFCFLPLAHIFERQMSANVFVYGGSIAFPRLGGTSATMLDDVKLCRPTFLANVPRIFTKIESGVKDMVKELTNATTVAVTAAPSPPSSSSASSSSSSSLSAFSSPFERGDLQIGSKASVDKLRETFGLDKMDMFFTGSAPIASDTIRFLKTAFGVGMTQGYGSSESFGGVLLALPNHEPSVGTCGALAPSTEARLRALPEMGYSLSDPEGPRGELQLRGPQMFTHYLKNSEETQKSVDEEGWFSTGDVAQITHEGWFIIIDRVKNFFKLSQGEYVTPEKIENTYLSASPLLTQVFAHGELTSSFMVGVIGIDPQTIVPHLRRFGVKGDLSSNDKIIEVCNQREIRTQILLTINTAINSKLNGFEKLHNIHVEIEPLRLERDVITPTSKIKRPIAAKFFKKQIDEMYAEGSILRNLKL